MEPFQPEDRIELNNVGKAVDANNPALEGESSFSEVDLNGVLEFDNQGPSWAQCENMPTGLFKENMADTNATQRLVRKWSKALGVQGPRVNLQFLSSTQGDLWVRWGKHWKLLTWKNNPAKFISPSTILKQKGGGVNFARALGIF